MKVAASTANANSGTADRSLEPEPSSVAARRERWVVLMLIVVAVASRWCLPGRMAIEHFDEGVYASNLWFGPDDGFEYPDRHLYAPPLLPALIEWSMTFLGPTGFGPMLPSLLAGTLTVVLCWWTARKWFGVEAGLAAGILAATSDMHALYCRTALTDSLLCFWILLAVGWNYRALVGTSLWPAVLAGVATGLAWWTKYNGWLPLAIGLSGSVAWLVFTPAARSRWRRVVVVQMTCILVAAIVWAPVLLQLQSTGGYAAVAANHAKYVVGLDGWWDSLTRQFANQATLHGNMSLVGLLVAVAVPCWIRKSRARFTWNGALLLGLCLLPAFFIGAFAWELAIFAMVGIMFQCLGNYSPDEAVAAYERQDDDPTRRALTGWLLAAWYVGLSLATPLYHPYPRLTLPWLLVTWLAGGAAVGGIASRLSGEIKRPGPADPPSKKATRTAAGVRNLILIALLLLLVGDTWTRNRGTLIPQQFEWESRSGLRDIVGNMVDDMRTDWVDPEGDNPSDIRAVVYVYAEPGLFYHLAADADDFVTHPVGDLPTAHPIPTYLAVGPHGLRSDAFRDRLGTLTDRYGLVAKYAYHPSMLVLLNEYGPSDLADRPVEEVRLYRVR